MKKNVLESSDERGNTVYVPSLPGCISEGNTKEEAITTIKETIELYPEPVEDYLTLSPDHEITGIAVLACVSPSLLAPCHRYEARSYFL